MAETTATPEEDLPALPADITAEWLSSKLGHNIASITNTRTIWGTGSKLFYTITYADDETTSPTLPTRPTHICIKGVFGPAILAAQPWTLALAQREAHFFSRIAPTLSTTPMLFPHGWWGGVSPTQGIAIMSDLTKEGCTFPAEAASYPVEMVKSGVEQLAALHALYWGQSEAQHAWIWNNYDPAMRFMVGMWDEVVRAPGRPVLPEYLMDGKRANEALDRYFNERNPRFRTLLHGDTHMGNVYFTSDGRIGFLDWSAFHFGSCFHDVVYHVVAMLNVEGRRAHEMEILEHYLEALHRFGGPKFDTGDEEVMREYRRSMMTNVVWLVCPDGLQSKERVDVLCERTVAAFGDHQVLDVILERPVPSGAAA